jgi:A1 cistron-splicing factor AAR2
MDQEPINLAKGFLTPDEALKLYPKTGILIL